MKLLFKRKRGEILVENLIFIILNLIFLSILIGFIILKANTFSLSEEKYAKEVALLIDSAKSGDLIIVNMEKVIDEASDHRYSGVLLQKLEGNVIQAKFSEKGAYTYSYFNNQEVNIAPSRDGKNYVVHVG